MNFGYDGCIVERFESIVNMVGREDARLKWACRRGMLELDVILERYVAFRYAQADEAEQALFHQFLTLSDQTLFDWLVKRLPAETKYHALINILLNNAQRYR